MDFITNETASFIQAIGEARDLKTLSDVVEATLARMGVQYFALYEFNGTVEEGICGKYPIEWATRYAEQRYDERDPVTLKLRRQQTGFHWNEKTLGEQSYLENGNSKKVFYEGCDFGLREGYTYLMADIAGQHALTSFTSDRVDADPKMLPALHLVSLYMHGKYRELTRPRLEIEAQPLTPRERECMQWAAQGKTNWEIAQILKIKETTVQSHIEAAKRKLNTPSRTHAVVRSLQQGLIRL